jgi:catechol 2,3-dioxygenase-like lactoylglutathione lyase family enzyme
MDYKIEVIVVPVTDIDRAKAFYSEQLGFNVDVDDSPTPDVRIVQLTPPGSGCSVTIGKGMGVDMVPGTLKGVQICVGDIEAARAELVSRGVEISPVRNVGPGGWQDGHGGDWNAFCFFDDPDGNSWAIQESPTIRAQMLADTATRGAT